MKSPHAARMDVNPAVLFLDYHGVLTELDARSLHSPPSVQFISTAVIQAMVSLSKYHLFVISNQPGVALGDFSMIVLSRALKNFRADLHQMGVRLDGFLYCPHHPFALLSEYRTPCRCRKPSAFLVRQALDSLGVHRGRALLVGDTLETDIACAMNAGIGAVWITQSADESLDSGGAPSARFTTLIAAVPFIHAFFEHGGDLPPLADDTCDE